MSDGFSIGGIALDSWSTPSRMMWPSGHKINKHVFVGGARHIDAMGPDPAPIQWSGRAKGSSAASNMMALRAMCIAGAQVPLIWNAYTMTVIVTSFMPVYRSPIEWDYQITVEIVNDPMAAAVGAVASTIDSIVSADVNQLAGMVQ